MIRTLVALVLAVSAARAQPPEGALELDPYLVRVTRGNPQLVVRRYEAAVADGEIEVARRFPEPYLSGGVAAFDVVRGGAPTALELGVSQTFELGGKRSHRILVAERGAVGARAEIEDQVRTLRGAATDAFIDALALHLIAEEKQRTYANLVRLVEMNEQRHRKGDLGEVPVMQARVEAERFHGELLVAQGEIRVAELGLGQLVGTSQPIVPLGRLDLSERAFDATALITDAKAHRPDVLAARARVDQARAKQDLAISNRRSDVTVGVGWTHGSTATGSYAAIAPTPAVDLVSATLSIPLPFARLAHHGELDVAVAEHARTATELRAVEVNVEVEIAQALARYRATVERLKLYTGGILAAADKSLEAVTYDYTHGGATLLEVIEAQRSVDGVYLAYYQSLDDHAHALIAVEVAAGSWDVKL